MNPPPQEEASERTARVEEVSILLPPPGNEYCDSDIEEINKERQQQVRELQKEAFQLANYYFVFQGVIFTAFYNTPSNLKCRYHWIPFTLSLLAGVLNLCALTTIAFKYKYTLDEIDKCAMMMCVRGNHAPPSVGVGNDPNTNESIAVKCARHWRLVYVVGCMGLFVGFFVVTLIGCWKITCGDSSFSATAPQAKAP